jgi:hypothetical protein
MSRIFHLTALFNLGFTLSSGLSLLLEIYQVSLYRALILGLIVILSSLGLILEEAIATFLKVESNVIQLGIVGFFFSTFSGFCLRAVTLKLQTEAILIMIAIALIWLLVMGLGISLLIASASQPEPPEQPKRGFESW